jgi:maltose alpha-D-glucosyltransferase/alpha-amylase
LLARVRRLIQARRSHAAFGRGHIQFVPTGVDEVLAFLRRHDDDSVLVVANLSGNVQSVTLQLGDAWVGRRCVEVVDAVDFPAPSGAPYSLALAPYGVYWLAAVSESPKDSQISEARKATPFFA